MTLRDALKKSGWDAFRNLQNEEWNVSDLLNEVLENESQEWLDRDCSVVDNGIIDCHDDLLSEI